MLKSISKWLFCVAIFFHFQINSIFAADADASKGEATFKQYCASCHKLNSKLVGPPLSKIYDQESEAWLIRWVRNNAELRGSGDKDANKIYQDYGQVQMTIFLNLQPDDVKNVLAYIKREDTAPAAGGGTGGSGGATDTGNPYANIMLWMLIAVLLLAIFFLTRNNSFLTRLAKQKAGEEVAPKSTTPFWKNPRWIAVIIIALVIIGFYKTVEETMKLGRSQSYQPEQPIAYSHKVHAGINGINCRYCHVGAEKGKQAGIPSLNICMNCHKAINAYAGEPIYHADGTPIDGTKEIQKIYAAIGWDPTTGKYTGIQHEVQWTRIHNLPGHVYFNHSQHVVAGQIECQHCHGEIQTMDVVQQHASLSMGWCIKCHRETKVRFAENNYYGMFEKLHQDLEKGKIKQVTEADMGGTECQKCHY